MKNIITVILLVGVMASLFMSSYYENRIDRIRQFNDSQVDSLKSEIDTVIFELDSLYMFIDSLPLGSPLDTLVVSSRYGWRRKPMGIGWQKHTGVDFMAAWHDTVYASGSGIVSRSGWSLGYGRRVVIDHSNGIQSTYSHLYRLFVKKGDSVVVGQPIGRAGNSGHVTGPHLHYEIIHNGKKIDPTTYLDSH